MYILFEGIDTCGKSTQIKLLSNKFKDAIITKEPGGSQFGQTIREILLHTKLLSKKAELFLFLADRAEHYKEIIEPNKDKLILSDRGFLSGVGYALANDKNIDFDYLINLNKFALENHFPDLIIFFKIDITTLAHRMQNDNKELDTIELRGLEYLIRVQEHMVQTLKKLDISYIFVDATQNIEVIHQILYSKIKELKEG